MAEVTRKHRALAYTAAYPTIAEGDKIRIDFVEKGIEVGGLGGYLARIAQALADIEAEAIAQVPRWISCEERMPPDGEDALVYAPARGVDWATFDEDNGGRWLWQYSGYGILSEVTHWMPVPSPPETK